MATAIVADDEPLMRESLKEQLQSLWPQLVIVAEAEDGPSALNAIEYHRPDVVFLDIRMPGLSGLEVAQALTAPTRVVFITAFDSHAVEAFDANALDYVLKPVEAARLAKVVTKIKKSMATAPMTLPDLHAVLAHLQPDAASADSESDHAPGGISSVWLQVAMGSQIRMVHVDDVMYFEADSKYTRVVAEDFEGLIRISLKELLDSSLLEAFVQTHRSTIVNRRFIRSVHRTGEVVEIELKGRPERLKVSTSNHPLFKPM